MGGAASVEKKRQKPQQLRQQQHEQQRQQFDKAQQSEQLVDAFLTQQMQAVAVKGVFGHRRVPSVCVMRAHLFARNIGSSSR